MVRRTLLLCVGSIVLYQMLDKVGTVAGEHIDDGNLDHCVAAGLETHGGAGNVNQDLTSQGRVVDAHVELQTLVLCLAADTFAHKVHTVTHVAYIVDALYLEDMRLIAGKIGVGLDGCCHLFELGTVFEFYIDHAAMDTFAKGNGH